MCRIYGCLGDAVDPMRIDLAATLLERGGPDGQNFESGAGWAIGSTRLAIMDPGAGNQPYSLKFDDCAGQIKVVFNGEIYNHNQLREDLMALGYTFRDRCDGSVIPALYHRYGSAFVERLDGMYSIAVLDLRDVPVLILATDPIGMKPLYFHRTVTGGHYFASELRALRALAGHRGSPREDRLDAYLTTRTLLDGKTMYSDIEQLPPGSVTTVIGTRVSTSRHGQRVHRPKLLPDSPVERIRHALRSEVAQLARADVPVASIVSGGLDSSLVTAMLAEIRTDVESFHIRYRGEWPKDEARYAREVCAMSGVALHEIELNPSDIPNLVEAVSDTLSEPNSDPITVSSHALFAAVRAAGYSVVLTGDGADEVFGGYDRTVAAVRKGSGWVDGYVSALAAVPEGLRTVLYSDHYRAHVRDTGSEADRLRRTLNNADGSVLSTVTEFELRQRMPAYHLRRVDHIAMGHAVETRLPFCQRSMVSAASGLSADLLISERRGKDILHRAGEGILPRSVIDRPKQPFTLPITALLNGVPSLWDFVRTTLTDCVAHDDLLDRHAVQSLMTAHRTRPTAELSATLWALVVFIVWHKRARSPAALSHA